MSLLYALIDAQVMDPVELIVYVLVSLVGPCFLIAQLAHVRMERHGVILLQIWMKHMLLLSVPIWGYAIED